MLETAKYIDGDNFVVIYKNFTKMTTEERIHLMEAINGAEMFPAAGVEPDTGKDEIKSLDDFTTQMALPPEKRDMAAIRAYLHDSVQAMDPDEIKNWSKGQVTSFVKIYQPFIAKHVWTLIRRANNDGYEMAKDLLICLKETV